MLAHSCKQVPIQPLRPPPYTELPALSRANVPSLPVKHHGALFQKKINMVVNNYRQITF